MEMCLHYPPAPTRPIPPPLPPRTQVSNWADHATHTRARAHSLADGDFIILEEKQGFVSSTSTAISGYSVELAVNFQQ